MYMPVTKTISSGYLFHLNKTRKLKFLDAAGRVIEEIPKSCIISSSKCELLRVAILQGTIGKVLDKSNTHRSESVVLNSNIKSFFLVWSS